MFLVENVIPCRNGLIVQGRFQVAHPNILPGDQWVATRDGVQVGMVRFLGIINANFTHDISNPRYFLSVAADKSLNYQQLIGTLLTEVK